MIKVSVIIPAYNIENYIQRCIDSAINQTLKEIEIIIVNDDSTDKTLEKIQEKAKFDNRIKLINNQQNEGPNNARILALKQAKGRYIQFIDGDDWIDLNTCSILYKKAETTQADVILYHVYTTDGRNHSLFKGYHNFDKNNKTYKECLLWHIFPSIVVKFIKREFLTKNKIFFPKDFSYSEDLAAGNLLFMSNPKVKIVDDILYYYYMRTDSATNRISNKVLEIDRAVEFIKKKLMEKKLYEECIYEFEWTVFNNNFLFYTLSYVMKDLKIAKKLFELFKNRNIDIYENPHIKNLLDKQSFMMTLVIKAMYKNFYLGAFLMIFRNKINNFLIKIERFSNKMMLISKK